MEHEYLGYNKLKIHHPEGGFDDYVDALALMAWGLSRGKSATPFIQFIDEKKEKPTGKHLVPCSVCGEYFRSASLESDQKCEVCSES
jgi:hypothetical protein